MRKILGGVSFGLTLMACGVLLDRVLWLPPTEARIRAEMKARYVQPVDLYPAIYQQKCSKETLRQALEKLRVCRNAMKK